MASKSEQINDILNRGINEVIPSKEALKKKLEGDEKLTIYLGIDPTAPFLHLGHSIPLLTLRRFQRLGHKTILLLGDFTAKIGDPSGKTFQRKPLNEKEISENAKTYKKQAGKILDFSGKNGAKLTRNSKWNKKLSFDKVLEIASGFTVQQMVVRDMFQERILKEKPIGLHEFLYPLIQGYDSVALETDAEVGGSDQLFNMIVGRDLVKRYLKKEKFVITTSLLVDPVSGVKMSKSEGTLVALNDEPRGMYAKIMAFPDELVGECFKLCTEVSAEETESILKLPPKKAKMSLAREIVVMYHTKEAAKEAEDEFEKVFSNHEAPSDMPEIRLSVKKINIIDLLIETGLTGSRGEARRLVEQGGIKINKETKKDIKEEIVIKKGMIVQVGKRRFLELL